MFEKVDKEKTALNQATILIVDDQPVNIQVLAALLKDEYLIQVASSGAKALEIAQGVNPPTLILLDIQMPEIDGYEVCRKLKSNERTSHIPVIFVTARDSGGDEEEGLKLGAIDYVTKPIQPAIVKARIRNHIALEMTITELRRALSEIKTLRGIVPICASCKKIRDDKGYWSQVEVYVCEHSEAQFSHGICPDCVKKLYPDYEG